MHVALHSVLREGCESAYMDAHATIPEDLMHAFERVGIHEWAIWRSGRDLFHLVDCDDFAAAMNALSIDRANERWQAFIGRFVDHFVAAGQRPEDMILPGVWTLSGQRDR